MRMLRALGSVLVAAGAGLTLLGVMSGDIQVGLALFFIPYLYGSSALGGLAILSVFAGLVLLIFDGFAHGAGTGHGELDPEAPEGVETRKKYGGVVLVGPIPIVFGSSDRTALYALIVAAGVVIALMLAFLLL